MIVSAALYERPRSLPEALDLLDQPDAVILCGGTDFYPERLHQPRSELVVDISRVDELGGVEQVEDGWRIGATTTWREVREAPLPRAFDGLRQAAGQIGAVQIQNAATVGGNLCTASPAGDGIPPLLTLNARVEVRSIRGTRVVALEDFLTGYRSTTLGAGELVSAVLIPTSEAGARGSFVKFGTRSHLVISTVMVAAVVGVSCGVIDWVRVAVGACSPVARRLAAVEQALTRCPYEYESVRAVLAPCELGVLTPIDDVRASADFRSRVVRELIGDAVMSDEVDG